MGVLEELLNQGETFSFGGDTEQENFKMPVRGFGKVGGRPMVTQVPQQTIIPQASPQTPFVAGQRAGVPSAKAQFDITIKRLAPIDIDGNRVGDALDEDLQVIIFQSSQIKGHYKKSLSYGGSATYLGVDGGNIINPNVQLPNYRFDAHRFIYVVRGRTNVYHTVLITCPQIDYTVLLNALESDIIRINYIKYFVPSAYENIQFNKRFEFIETSQFGKKSNDAVPVLSNIKSNDFKDRLIEIPVNFYVDKTKGLLLDIAPIMIEKELVLSLFVDYTDRQSI
jgi:hypothetical protein